MTDKVKPLPPIKVKINLWNYLKLGFLIFISCILWITLIVTGINLLGYYIKSIIINGFFDPETLKYAVMLVVGAYFFLILDKNKIYEALNVKRGLPFITVEQIEEKKK
jgi:hypothetical protein